MKEFERMVKTMKSGPDAKHLIGLAKDNKEKQDLIVKELVRRIALGQEGLSEIATAVLVGLL